MEVNGQPGALPALSPEKKASGMHQVGGWVDPRADVNVYENTKMSSPCMNLYSGSSSS